MCDELEFQPKAGGETWVAYIGEADFSGYDIVLMLDKKDCTADSGWMLELAVEPDGSVTGQITSRPGSDALVLFTNSRDKFTACGNYRSPSYTIRSDGKWNITENGTIDERE